MRKMKLYIETSAWNFYYADDEEKFRDITKQFFELVYQDYYDIYISDVVVYEISRASEDIKLKLMNLIEKAQPKKLSLDIESKVLANKYLERNVLPQKKKEDAYHVAIASINEMDAIITWNFKHMTNLRRTGLFNAINIEEGYLKRISLVTPMEVLDNEIS